MTEDRLIKVRALLTVSLCFQLCTSHPERELCTDGATDSDITSPAGHASVTVCRRHEGRGRQSLRGTCPHRSASTHAHSPIVRTFFSYIGRLSKSEEEKFAHNLDLQTSRNRAGCASIHRLRRSMIMPGFVPSYGKSWTNSKVALTHLTSMTHPAEMKLL